MNGTSSSDSPPSSPTFADPSSQQTTPDQSPGSSPTSAHPPALSNALGTPDGNVPQQQIVSMMDDEPDHLRDYRRSEHLFRMAVKQEISRERQRLAEFQERAAADQNALREERDEDQRQAAQERARAERHERSLTDARDDIARVEGQLRATEEQHRSALGERDTVTGQLQEKAQQLVQAQNELLGSYIARQSFIEYLARMANEKNELQQELNEARGRLVTMEGNLAEHTRSNERYRAVLSDLQTQFDEEEARRGAVEEQLNEQADELHQVRSELDDERTRSSRLQSELDGERTELVALDALRSEADGLRERSRNLEDENVQLRNGRGLLEREVHDLREQERATTAELETVRIDLRNEQRSTRQLQDIAANLQGARQALDDEVQQLRVRNGRLESANSSLQRTNGSLGRDNEALEARCAALNTQATGLQTRIDQEDAIRERAPRRLGFVRGRDSPRKVAICQKRPIAMYKTHPIRPMFRMPITA